jgi:hypothetical protein
MSDKNDALVRAGFLSFMDKQVIKPSAEEVRAGAVLHCEPGESGAIRSPLDGGRVGRYSVTDPQYAGSVSDRSAADRWVLEHYPEKGKTRTRITDQVEAAKVLRAAGREDLVVDERYVPDHVVHELVVKSESAGEPVGFGGEAGADAPAGVRVLKPSPQLRITLDKDKAGPAYWALWESGALAVTGELKQIEGASGD